VPIHDAGEVEGQLYLVMRYVAGRDLKALLADGRSRRNGQWPSADRWRTLSTPRTHVGSSTGT
jgi:hypothetical protein